MASTAARTNETVIREAYAAFNEGDMETVFSIMSPDVEWVEPQGSRFSGTHRGADSVMEEVFAPVAAEMAEFVVEVDRVIDAGDTVVVLGTDRGTVRDSGETVAAPFAHVIELRDGQITRCSNYTDTHAWEQALAA
ncbi:nuclear transport factor 2 family protein [Halobaculum marinum]|uniref:Nuclear transport factor 2 family protein n=1 Tax=Halobaculum marinum TaxID=3031996 RepID=A0ABD5X122_9EURY|nr:nuclear transport factor 2 family protein [Halobaculum sp. DT55]